MTRIRIVFVALVAMFAAATGTAVAQDYNFADFKFGETEQITRQKAAKAGFEFDKYLKTDDTALVVASHRGRFFDEYAQLMLHYVNGRLAKTAVIALTDDNDCFGVFVRVGLAMVEKYGKPTANHNVDTVFENTAVNRYAVQNEGVEPSMAWGDYLGLSVRGNLTVHLIYESKGWVTYVDATRARQGALL